MKKIKTLKINLLTLKQAEEQFGIKADTLRKRIKAKVLPALKVGKTWLVSPEDLRY